jgi:rhomboid protease GluP
MRPDEGDALLITEDLLTRCRTDERIDFERGMSYAPRLTLAIMVGLIIVFGFQVAAGSLSSETSLVAAGALVRANVATGEWWRLFTATILHGGPDHLIGNLISLYILGMACEHAFGTRRLVWVYVISGLAGSCLSMMLNPGPSVGASGAIFGLMGAIVVFLARHEDKFHVRDKRVGVVLVIWATYTLAQGFLTPYVDNGAHLGGLAMGAVFGGFLPPRVPSRHVRK